MLIFFSIQNFKFIFYSKLSVIVKKNVEKIFSIQNFKFLKKIVFKIECFYKKNVEKIVFKIECFCKNVEKSIKFMKKKIVFKIECFCKKNIEFFFYLKF